MLYKYNKNVYICCCLFLSLHFYLMCNTINNTEYITALATSD